MRTKIKLLDGRTKAFDTTENDTYKFYFGSGVHGDMQELHHTLTLLGNVCEVFLSSVYGWTVRVRK